MLRRDSTGHLATTRSPQPNATASARSICADRPAKASSDAASFSDASSSSDAATSCHQSMASLIADEIIPRLIAAHRAECSEAFQVTATLLDAANLADMAIQSDARHLADLSEVAMSEGLSFEALMLDVMAPAARILGERWEDDSADFIEVTLGLWRLQELVHELASRRCGTDTGPVMHERRILCAVAPGDDHSFGSLVLEEIFRRAGWSCSGLRGASRAQLLRQVAEGWFEIIALTVSVERNSEVLTDLVADVRAASCNPGVSVMVGGPVFSDHASLADEIGADATASNARAALHKAELLVGQYMVGSGGTAAERTVLHTGPQYPAARAGIQPG